MKFWKSIFALLILVAMLVWLAVFKLPDSNLHLVACDVGQGDAILAIYGKVQILVDGGPDKKVLDCLSRHLPFWDREIEMVILSHPEEDHYGGLIEVFRRYKVDNFLDNGLESSNQSYQVLKKEVGGNGATVVPAVTGMVIRSRMIYIDILWPEDVVQTKVSNPTPNSRSIVAELKFGNFKAILTGDIQPPALDDLLSKNVIKTANYIKVPHHGSKNGLTKELLDAVDPKLAVISVGKNQWGHPNKESLDLLKEKNIEVFRTDEKGDIAVITNGEKWWIKD